MSGNSWKLTEKLVSKLQKEHFGGRHHVDPGTSQRPHLVLLLIIIIITSITKLFQKKNKSICYHILYHHEGLTL